VKDVHQELTARGAPVALMGLAGPRLSWMTWTRRPAPTSMIPPPWWSTIVDARTPIANYFVGATASAPSPGHVVMGRSRHPCFGSPSVEWMPVVVGNYRDFFVVIASSSATLIGLLFVAMSVSMGRAQAHPQVIREFRAAASLLAFTNPFTVALFGLVPTTNIGYPAAIVGTVGVLFIAAGVRTTLSLSFQQQQRRPQLALIVALLVVFGFQIANGVELIIDSHHEGALGTIGDVLIASLLIGIGRAWELVGEWDAGLIASVARLIGHRPQAPVAIDSHRDDSEGSGSP
jgi:hypothetical protein